MSARNEFSTADERWLKALGISVPAATPEPAPVASTRPTYICETCKFKSCDCTPPETSRCPEYRVNCACWSTGLYLWVPGCPHHPRESMT